MVTINRTGNYPVKRLVDYKRKDTLVIVYIETEINENRSIFHKDWFFACNTDQDILEHLRGENVDTSLFNYKLEA